MEPGEKRTFCFPSSVASARRAGACSRQAAAGLFPATDCSRLELALVEAFTNTVEHAYGGAVDRPVWLTITREPEQLVFELEDEAGASDFNPAAVPEPTLGTDIAKLPEGGWGVFLITQIMDGVSHTRCGGRNRLRLAKSLPLAHRCAAGLLQGFPPAEVPDSAASLAHLRRQAIEQDEMIRDMTDELSAAYESLNLFFNFSHDVTALTDEKGLLQKVLELAVGYTEAAWAVVRLRREDQWLPCVPAGIVPAWFPAAGRDGAEVENQVLASGQEEVRAAGAHEALMCVPIRGRERLLGILLIGGKPRAPGFSAGDVKLARALADQAAASLENQRMVKEVTEAQVARHELQIAQRMQQQFYPRNIPDIPGLRSVAEGIPARLVGGDYIGLRESGDGQGLDFIIADAMGKGMQAAVFSSLTHEAFRCFFYANPDMTPAAVLTAINRNLFPDLERVDMFMTALCGHIDVRNNRLTYASAGHCLPVLLPPRGSARLLETPDYMLGVHRDAAFQQRRVAFGPGCRLLVYTDGFTDIPDRQGTIPGPEPLRQRWQLLRHLSLPAACRKLMDDTLASTGPTGLPDDIALMAFERVATPPRPPAPVLRKGSRHASR